MLTASKPLDPVSIFSENVENRISAVSWHLKTIRARIESYSIGLQCLTVSYGDDTALPLQDKNFVFLGSKGVTSEALTIPGKKYFLPALKVTDIYNISLSDIVTRHPGVEQKMLGSVSYNLTSGIDKLFFGLIERACIKIPWYQALFRRRVTMRLMLAGISALNRNGTHCAHIILPAQFSEGGLRTIKKLREYFPDIRVTYLPGITRIYFLPSPTDLGVVMVKNMCDVYAQDSFVNAMATYGFCFTSELGMAVYTGSVYSRKVFGG